MNKSVVVLFLALLILGVPYTQVLADGCPFSLRIYGQAIAFYSGDAGSGTNAPEYDDAFDKGVVGAGVEGEYTLNKKFSILAGIGYESCSGQNWSGIIFDDRRIMPVYIGAKYNLKPTVTGWNPYLRADVGFARSDSVDISYMGNSTLYWDSSWDPLFDFGAGVEYRRNSYGFFLEIKARYMDAPSSAMSPFSDADETWSIPVTLGVSIYF